ncbi:MAG: N-acetyltransferase [Dehalococcoidia bacterium]|jgi:amino-acid N-acetyltransferase|nr:N-acetyltransferase [Chloroflexota bacterium]MCK4242389.1 N-acetyltransferase [Dehalococcoidia bacterium]
MKVGKARIDDIPQVHRLVNYFAAKGDMLPRAMSELYENIRDLFVVKDNEQLIACAAFHIFWSDLAEIRSVAVAEDKQDQGVGALLIQACLDEAGDLGLETVFTLTNKPDFFERFGFHRVDVMELPRKVWGECQRCPKFPNCDEIALVRNVEAP